MDDDTTCPMCDGDGFDGTGWRRCKGCRGTGTAPADLPPTPDDASWRGRNR